MLTFLVLRYQLHLFLNCCKDIRFPVSRSSLGIFLLPSSYRCSRCPYV